MAHSQPCPFSNPAMHAFHEREGKEKGGGERESFPKGTVAAADVAMDSGEKGFSLTSTAASIVAILSLVAKNPLDNVELLASPTSDGIRSIWTWRLSVVIYASIIMWFVVFLFKLITGTWQKHIAN